MPGEGSQSYMQLTFVHYLINSFLILDSPGIKSFPWAHLLGYVTFFCWVGEVKSVLKLKLIPAGG